jgi:hypothetical protein
MHSMAIYPLAIQIASDQAGNAQNPALHLRHLALLRGQVGFQERGKAAIPVSARQPIGYAIGIVLVALAPLVGEATAPQCRIDLGDGRAPARDRATDAGRYGPATAYCRARPSIVMFSAIESCGISK